MKEMTGCSAIVLAAGKGSRMKSEVHKQFMLLGGKPVLYYSLHCFQESSLIDEIILVTSEDMIDYCRSEIVEKYSFDKVKKIVGGGKERYDSVYEGLKACSSQGIVCVHDSARPFITEDILKRGIETAESTGACIVGVPAKDTMKLADENNDVDRTIPREKVWIVQTPQIFSYSLLKNAYESARLKGMNGITDDAMVVERETECKVRFSLGSYRNIKITTPEDLIIGEAFLSS